MAWKVPSPKKANAGPGRLAGNLVCCMPLRHMQLWRNSTTLSVHIALHKPHAMLPGCIIRVIRWFSVPRPGFPCPGVCYVLLLSDGFETDTAAKKEHASCRKSTFTRC